MSATTTLREAVEAIEAALDAAPSLGVRRSDPLSGTATMTAQRGATGYFVRREITRNLDETRNADVSRVQDLLIVELQTRIGPKAQTVSRGDLYDRSDTVRNRITDLDFNRKWNLIHVDTREELRPGEWFKLLLRFSLKRFEIVGAG